MNVVKTKRKIPEYSRLTFWLSILTITSIGVSIFLIESINISLENIYYIVVSIGILAGITLARLTDRS
jgi:hypothetical protein